MGQERCKRYGRRFHPKLLFQQVRNNKPDLGFAGHCQHQQATRLRKRRCLPPRQEAHKMCKHHKDKCFYRLFMMRLRPIHACAFRPFLSSPVPYLSDLAASRLRKWHCLPPRQEVHKICKHRWYTTDVSIKSLHDGKHWSSYHPRLRISSISFLACFILPGFCRNPFHEKYVLPLPVHLLWPH